jgi:hypothetical protein
MQIDRLKVKIEKYNWGPLLIVSADHSWSAIFHPKNIETLLKLTYAQEMFFVDEQGEHWRVTKNGLSENRYVIKGTQYVGKFTLTPDEVTELKNTSSLEESEEKDKEFKTYTITAKDPEGNLRDLLEYIKSLGNTGHSFEIVVDPNKDDEKKFYWDGDGSDSIKNIK